MMQPVTAQILFKGHPDVYNISCGNELGKIMLNVRQTNPPYTYEWDTGQTTETITDLETGSYTVKITDAVGTDTILHFNVNELECDLAPEIFFTPNGDGINDYWEMGYALYFSNAFVVVFNKLGQKVFEFSGKYERDDWWDGTDLLGKPLPTGSYFYISYPNKSDKSKFRKGTVSIIR